MVKKWRLQPRGVSKKTVILTTFCSHQLRVHYTQELEQGLQKIAARQRKHLPDGMNRQRKHLPDGMNSSFFEGWCSWHSENRPSPCRQQSLYCCWQSLDYHRKAWTVGLSWSHLKVNPPSSRPTNFHLSRNKQNSCPQRFQWQWHSRSLWCHLY